jgi:hypothetical protein
MSTQWHTVQAWATERLVASRQKLESSLDPVQTEHTRGRIAVLKELIALPGTLKSLSDARLSNGGPE